LADENSEAIIQQFRQTLNEASEFLSLNAGRAERIRKNLGLTEKLNPKEKSSEEKLD